RVLASEYSNKPLPVGKKLLTDQLGAACDRIAEDWIQKALRKGRFVFFVDGFDEVIEARRKEVAEWIEDLLSSYPESFVVVRSC
ncbi:MAG: hypothetical protein AAFY26_26910, partial [Cyanobacteria bacterium J06638_22]